MAERGKRKKAPAERPHPWRRAALRAAAGLALLAALVVTLYAFVNPPVTPTILAARWRLGSAEQTWVPLEAMAAVVARSVVAAEDANFCRHWGFDIDAIRAAAADGAGRGASTISQQVVKNVYLWQGRSWPRKALEALLTPAVEIVWTKRRILEVYLNVAEMGEGVFGIEAAAQHWFGLSAAELGPREAARLAAILPDPRGRSPAEPSAFVSRRAAAIADGAATIAGDGRAACFGG